MPPYGAFHEAGLDDPALRRMRGSPFVIERAFGRTDLDEMDHQLHGLEVRGWALWYRVGESSTTDGSPIYCIVQLDTLRTSRAGPKRGAVRPRCLTSRVKVRVPGCP